MPVKAKAWNHNTYYHRALLRLVPAPCASALDVGCGDGTFALRLASVCREVTAVDADLAQVEMARRTCAAVDNVEIRQGDVLSMELDQESFDLVTALAVLHHFPLEAGLGTLVAAAARRQAARTRRLDRRRHRRRPATQPRGRCDQPVAPARLGTGPDGGTVRHPGGHAQRGPQACGRCPARRVDPPPAALAIRPGLGQATRRRRASLSLALSGPPWSVYRPGGVRKGQRGAPAGGLPGGRATGRAGSRARGRARLPALRESLRTLPEGARRG